MIKVISISCWLMMAMVLLTNVCIAQNLPAYLPSNGLVAWYPFNGNANDESGNGNDLSVFGPVLTTDRTANESSSYFFNGAASNAQYLITSNIEFLKNSNYSFSAWINSSEFYPNVPQTNPYQYDLFYTQTILSINNSSNWDIGTGIGVGLGASDNSVLGSDHWVKIKRIINLRHLKVVSYKSINGTMLLSHFLMEFIEYIVMETLFPKQISP